MVAERSPLSEAIEVLSTLHVEGSITINIFNNRIDWPAVSPLGTIMYILLSKM